MNKLIKLQLELKQWQTKLGKKPMNTGLNFEEGNEELVPNEQINQTQTPTMAD